MPPPRLAATQLANVQLVTFTVPPALRRPPPCRLPVVPVTLLLRNMQFVRLSTGAPFLTPPPPSTSRMSPFRIVKPEMLVGIVALPLLTLKILIFAPPLGWRASEPDPGPTIDIAELMSGNGVSSPV